MSGTVENPVDDSVETTSSSHGITNSRVRLRRRIVLLITAVLLAGVPAGYWWWSKERGLTLGQRAMDRSEWTAARRHLADYLDLHPSSDEANLLIAEAIAKSNSNESAASATEAIWHLQRIPSDSPLAATARLQEARLTFLILQQPGRAERLLNESLSLHPESFEASYLLWKLLDVTGRHTQTRKLFWQVHELATDDQKPVMLREWFLSEFYPENANRQYHTIFGAREMGSVPASVSLLVILREQEPSATFLHAAIAAYYLEKGQPETSLEVLRDVPRLDVAMEDRGFVFVLFESLVELGEMDKARTCFAQFPEPHSGYRYWRARGLYEQRVVLDASAAVEAYENCLQTWPARFDWELMNRYSECLRKIGRVEDAKAIQERVKYLTEDVLAPEKTSPILNGLSDPADPEVAGAIHDLYSEFGLDREATAWEAVRGRLATGSGGPNDGEGQ